MMPKEEKEFKKAFPESTKLLDKTMNEEITQILEFLGRTHGEGLVKGDHLSRILGYLHETKTEDYKKTVPKLALLCAMQSRYIKENYLDGLEAFGIIKVIVSSRNKIWTWNGLKDA